MRLFTTILFLFASTLVYAQTIKDLEKMEAQNQSCLDKGVDMVGCQLLYYKQLDSMLNLAYKAFRNGIPEKGKTDLKASQVQWLQKRDTYFRKLEKERDKADAEVSLLGMYLSMNNFVEDRVIYLIKQRKR